MNNFNKICLGKANTGLELLPTNAETATMEQQGQNVVVETTEPQPGALRWVKCKDYRCMGVLDREGRWRSFATGKELTDVIEVLSE